MIILIFLVIIISIMFVGIYGSNDSPVVEVFDILECPYPEDVGKIIRAHRDKDISFEKFANEGKDMKVKLVVLSVDGSVVSMARMIYLDNRPEYGGKHILINAVHTLEEHRGKGYARAVMNRVIEEADRPIKLEVDKDNEPAYNLYKSLGFETVSEDEEVYFMEFAI